MPHGEGWGGSQEEIIIIKGRQPLGMQFKNWDKFHHSQDMVEGGGSWKIEAGLVL